MRTEEWGCTPGPVSQEYAQSRNNGGSRQHSTGPQSAVGPPARCPLVLSGFPAGLIVPVHAFLVAVCLAGSAQKMLTEG